MNKSVGDRAALAHAVERCGLGHLGAVRRLGGRGRRVYECRPERGPDVIARVSDNGHDAFELEIAVARRLRLAGVPVPPFIDLIQPELDGTQAVLLQERSTGQTLRAFASASLPARSADSIERAGALLARVHACSASGFGPLIAADRGQAAHLSDWFVDGIDAAALRIRNSNVQMENETAEALAIMVAHRSLLDGASPGLVHGDWSPDNILVDAGGEPVAVVDFEAAKSGPPALDLGWWDCMFDSAETPSDALVRGYRRAGGAVDGTTNALRHLTVIRIALLFAAWASGRPDVRGEWASERLRRDLAEASRWSVVQRP